MKNLFKGIFLSLLMPFCAQAQNIEITNVVYPSNPVAGEPMTIQVFVENTDSFSTSAFTSIDFVQISGPLLALQSSDPNCFQSPGLPFSCGEPIGAPSGQPLKKNGVSDKRAPKNGVFTAHQVSSGFTASYTFTATPGAASYGFGIASLGPCSPTIGMCSTTISFTGASPTPEINANLQTIVSEDGGEATLSFSLSQAGLGDINLQVDTSDGSATAGENYVATSQAVTWPAGDTSPRSVLIPILDNTTFDGNKFFNVSITGVSSGIPIDTPVNFSITITEDDPEPAGTVEFVESAYHGDEDSGTISLTVRRKQGAVGDISVKYTSADGSATASNDYQAASGTLNWAAGDTSDKTLTVAILKDAQQEATEDFTVTLSEPSNGALLGNNSSTTISIDDIRDPQAPVVEPGADIEVTDFDGDGEVEVNLDASGSTSTNSNIAKVEWISGGNVVATGLTASAPFPVGTTQVLVRITNDAGLISEKLLTVVVLEQKAVPKEKLATTPGIDRNEQSLAETMDGICPRLAEANQLTPLTGASLNLLTRCEMLTNPGVSDADRASALDAIAGEEVAAIINTATSFANIQQNNVRTRLNQLRLNRSNKKQLVDTSGLRIQFDGGTISGDLIAEAISQALGGAAGADDDNYLIQSSRFGVFVNGSVLYGDKDKTDRQAGYDLEVKGLTMGMDYRITNNLVAGLALGYSDTSLDYNNSGGNMGADSVFYTAYGSYYNDANFYIDASVTRGQADYDMRRRVSYTDAAGLFEQNIQSSTDGRQLLGTLDVGYDFVRGALIIGPNAGLSYSKTNIDAFAEQGQSGLELDFSRQASSAQNMNIGMHSSYTFLRDWGVLIAQFSGNYYKDFKNDENQVFANFVHNPFDQGDTSISQMLIRTDVIDKSYMTFNFGLSAQFQHGLSGFVDYRYLAGARNVSSSEVSFGMRYELKF